LLLEETGNEKQKRDNPIMSVRWVRELIVTGAVIVFTLIVQFVLIPSQVEQAGEYDLASLSPAFFPKLATLFICGLSLLLLLNQLRHLITGIPPEADDEESLSFKEELRVAGVIGLSVVYYLVLDYLGFWITNTAVVSILLMIQDRSRIWRQIAIAAATTACVYLFFYFIMKVHFPIGKIFN
jgi:hypothetical protein